MPNRWCAAPKTSSRCPNRKDKKPFREDLSALFGLLGSGTIHPRIAARLPLLAGREAQQMLEAGGVAGKIVHLAQAPGRAG